MNDLCARFTSEEVFNFKKLDPQLQALTDFCQTLLTANEFLYVD